MINLCADNSALLAMELIFACSGEDNVVGARIRQNQSQKMMMRTLEISSLRAPIMMSTWAQPTCLKFAASRLANSHCSDVQRSDHHHTLQTRRSPLKTSRACRNRLLSSSKACPRLIGNRGANFSARFIASWYSVIRRAAII
jgi:hypothetical protein